MITEILTQSKPVNISFRLKLFKQNNFHSDWQIMDHYCRRWPTFSVLFLVRQVPALFKYTIIVINYLVWFINYHLTAFTYSFGSIKCSFFQVYFHVIQGPNTACNNRFPRDHFSNDLGLLFFCHVVVLCCLCLNFSFTEQEDLKHINFKVI